jgi:hypothetical protein
MITILVLTVLAVATELGQLLNFLLMDANTASTVWNWKAFGAAMILVVLSRGLLWKFSWDIKTAASATGVQPINGLTILIILVLLEIFGQAYFMVNSRWRLVFAPNPALENKLYFGLLIAATLLIIAATLVRIFDIRI